MLRRLVLIVVLLGALVGLAAVWGGTLPVGHRAAVSAHISRTPDVVFDALADFQGSLAWRSDITGIERVADRDGKPVWIEQGSHGPLPLEVTASEPPHRLLLTILPGADLPFEGAWTFLLAPEAEGTRLTVVEEGRVPSPLFRALGKLFFDEHATMRTYVQELGRHFGEVTVVAEVPAP